jgi:type IV secretory pathway VirB10-like protein
MEAVKKDSWFAKLFLKEAKPFVEKRDVNWQRITQAAVAGIVILVIALLFMPSSKPKITNFHEKSTAGSTPPVPQADGSSDALAQGQQSRSTPRFFGDSGQDRSQSRGGSGGGSSDRNSSMIIARGGNDGRTSLPPGSRIEIRLIEKITASAQPVPVIGIVERDVTQEDSLAIPQGAKIFGEASFDDNTERAQVSWKTIRLPDGRERPLSGIAISQDGQAGVEGNVHSDAVKNAIGQTLTRFVAAYADGSMQRGAFGANPGGDDNGLKNAISQTAKDRADALGQDMQKPKKWIELPAGTDCIAVLSSSFQFRDPGAFYGR